MGGLREDCVAVLFVAGEDFVYIFDGFATLETFDGGPWEVLFGFTHQWNDTAHLFPVAIVCSDAAAEFNALLDATLSGIVCC